MKITFVRSLDEYAGTRIRAHMLALAMARRGHDVTLIQGNTEKENTIQEEIKIINIKQQKSLISWIITIFKRMKKIGNPDVLIGVKSLPTGTIPCLLKKGKKPFLIDWDDYESGYAEKRDSFWLKHTIPWFERNIIKYADKVIIHSVFLEGKGKKFGVENKLWRVNQGVDIHMFRPDVKPMDGMKDYILHTATLGLSSDLDYLIDHIEPFFKKHKKEKMIVLGKGSRLEEFKNYIKNKNLQDNIILYGPVPHKDMPRFIKGAKVCVGLMRNRPENTSRCPLKLLEYMGVGAAVVTDDLGEAKKYLRDGENSLIAKTPEQFAEKVEILMGDKNLREKLSKNAVKTAQGWSWDSSAEELERCIDACLVH